ncbi:MAG: hypothetical protein ACE5IR_11840 [bacterium]
MLTVDKRLNRIERALFAETINQTVERWLEEDYPKAKKKNDSLKESTFIVQKLGEESEPPKSSKS